MNSFEVSIGLYPSFGLSHQKKPVVEVSWKSVNMDMGYLRKCAVLKLA